MTTEKKKKKSTPKTEKVATNKKKIVNNVSSSKDVYEMALTTTESASTDGEGKCIDVKFVPTVLAKGKKKPNFAKLSAIKGQKYNNEITEEFDYAGLIKKKPNVTVNKQLNLTFSIVDLIIEVVKSAGLSQMNIAIDSVLHPAEYDYSLDILNKVTEIEQNLAKLTEIVQLQAYQDCVLHRSEQLIGLTTATIPTYMSYIDLMRQYNDAEGDPTKQADIEKEMEDLVNVWGGYIINGTNSYFCCLNLMKMFLKSNVCNNKNYPQIFDEIGYKSYVWKTQSYPLRLTLREEDKYALFSALVLTCAYWHIKVKHGDITGKMHLESLQAYAELYRTFCNGNPCDVGTLAECTLSGHECKISESWATQRFTDSCRRAKDEWWRFDKAHQNTKDRFMYLREDRKNLYPTFQFIQALCAFYGNTKSIYEILSMHYLEVNGYPAYKFHDLNPANWIIVQGQMTWDRKSIKKNRDKIYCWIVPMSYTGGNYNPSQLVVNNCNITNHEVPAPMDPDPSYAINGIGEDVQSCGYYLIAP